MVQKIIFLLKPLKPLAFFLFFLLISACSKTNNDDTIIYDSQYKAPIIACKDYMTKYMVASMSPGFSICVTKDGDVLWSQAYGKASKELNVPASRNTLFRIGNNSEILTSYLIGYLNQINEISLDSSFYKYVPKFPGKQYDFTLRMLGAHASIFPKTSSNDLRKRLDAKNFVEYIKSFENYPLLDQPGSYYARSDYNTALLGMVAENTMQEAYYSLVKRMILDTLQIEQIKADNKYAIIPNRSDTYAFDYLARPINAPDFNAGSFMPVHGWLASAEGLNALAYEMLDQKLFSKESIELFTTGFDYEMMNGAGFGFGWLISSDDQNRKLMANMGSTIGGSSAVLICPDEKLVVSMCANKSDDDMHMPVYAVAQEFLKYLEENN